VKPLILALEAIILALRSIIAWLELKDAETGGGSTPEPLPEPTPEPEPEPEPLPEPLPGPQPEPVRPPPYVVYNAPTNDTRPWDGDVIPLASLDEATLDQPTGRSDDAGETAARR
jgi:hypothetical protein